MLGLSVLDLQTSRMERDDRHNFDGTVIGVYNTDLFGLYRAAFS